MRPAASADAVVIGGGILGCCAAYHLQKAGAGRVVLVERAPEVASQTTRAGAGFVSTWSAGSPEAPDLEVGMERYALRFYRELGGAQDIGLRDGVGIAFVAHDARTAEAQGEHHGLLASRSPDEGVELLDADGLLEKAPVLEGSSVLSGLFWPKAVRVDAPRAARAVAREFEAAGGRVLAGTGVTGIEVAGGGVEAVRTTEGRLLTEKVVNAAGAWLNEVSAMVGVRVPLVALPASRFVTHPIEGATPDLPLLMFVDHHNMYVREEEGGLLIGTEDIVFNPPDLMRRMAYGLGLADALEGSPDQHAAAGVPSDLASLPGAVHFYHEALARELASTVPALRGFRVRHVRNGMTARTPDLLHLLGQAQSPRGFYVVGADNECGVTHGPALGRMAAELVLEGATSADASKYRLDRWATRASSPALAGG